MPTTHKISEFPLEEEYKKKTGISKSDIAKLRDWLKTQPHLPQGITDLELIFDYHSCNKSAEVAKQVLDTNFTLRTLFTAIFKDRAVDKKLLTTCDVILISPQDERAYDGSAVLYGCLIDYDSKNFNFSDCIRSAIMMIDLWQYEEGTWPGFIIAIDLANITLSHLARLDLQTLQQLLYYLQEALFVKLKGLHFLNAPSFMDRLMMLLRPFLKKELMEMLVIHQVGSKTLEKYLPMDSLPREAGGKGKPKSEIKELTIAKFKANAEFFEKENSRRVDESKRPGKPKTITDIFGGVEGSFKKLEID